MRKPNLSGAFGVVQPVPAGGARLAHPERALRFQLYMQLLWAVRIGSVVSLLALLYIFHLIRI